MTAALINWSGIGPGSSDAEIGRRGGRRRPQRVRRNLRPLRRPAARLLHRDAPRPRFGGGLRPGRVLHRVHHASVASESPTSCARGSTRSSATKPTRDCASFAASGRLTRCPTSSPTMRARTRWPIAWSWPTSFPKRQAGFRIATRPCWSWLTGRGWTDPSSRWPSGSLRRTPTPWSAAYAKPSSDRSARCWWRAASSPTRAAARSWPRYCTAGTENSTS